MSDQTLPNLRKDYERGEFDESMAAPAPLDQFRQWLDEAIAAKVPEPNAMTLATVGVDGRPSTRVVLIKGFDARGLVWYTNYQSRKGQELAVNPVAAIQFFWPELERVGKTGGDERAHAVLETHWRQDMFAPVIRLNDMVGRDEGSSHVRHERHDGRPHRDTGERVAQARDHRAHQRRVECVRHSEPLDLDPLGLGAIDHDA